MSETMKWIVMSGAAYLLGAIPFAFLIARMHGVDIRTVGSGNVGASNVGRQLGRKWGMLCFVLDVLKGAGPTAAAGWWTGVMGKEMGALSAGQMFAWMGVGVCAILGHMLPVYLKFRGGKGVATGLGVTLAIYPHLTWPALAGLVTWCLVLKVWRYIALASIVAALSIPVWFAAMCVPKEVGTSGGGPERSFAENLGRGWPFWGVTLALGLVVTWRHRSNLGRMRAGTEPKVGAPK